MTEEMIERFYIYGEYGYKPRIRRVALCKVTTTDEPGSFAETRYYDRNGQRRYIDDVRYFKTRDAAERAVVRYMRGLISKHKRNVEREQAWITRVRAHAREIGVKL